MSSAEELEAQTWRAVDVAAKVSARDVERAAVQGWTLERLAVECGATLAEAALEVADLGVTLSRTWPRMRAASVERRVALAIAYKDCASHREAARRVGVSQMLSCEAWRAIFGASLNAPGGSHPNVKEALRARAKKRRAAILRHLRKLNLDTQAMSIRALVAATGADKATLTKIIREHNIPVRDHAPFTARVIDALNDPRCLADKEIAEMIGCSRATVAGVRRELGLKPGRARREALRSDPAPDATP